jgi:dihydroxy-acid dehydratase
MEDFLGLLGGAAIGHVSPEAAVGGPLAYIREGDIIEYDILARKINCIGTEAGIRDIDEINKIFKERAKEGIVPRPNRKGILKRYTSLALSAMQGAGYE